MQGAEIVVQGAEIVVQGAEIVVQGAEIVVQGAEIVVHQVHNHFCAGFTISQLSPNLQFIGIFILAKVLFEKPGFLT
ncbi:MAG: hypothetical protein F6K35_17345, partial [Okeania sp. SIO2H7]|nr:hypothetical protein [Okeania sp. SIO2H7]